MERLEYDLLFRWFVGIGVDDAAWDHSVFSKNNERLLESDIAAKFLEAVLAQAHLHEAAFGAVDRRAADRHRPRNGLVALAGIGSEPDLGLLELARRMLAASQRRLKFVAFGLVEIDATAYIDPDGLFGCGGSGIIGN